MSELVQVIVTYWTEFLLSFIVATLTLSYRTLRTAMVQQGHIKAGMIALLLERLEALYREAYREAYKDPKKGGVRVSTLQRAERVYMHYRALGGNSTGSELYERICKLPIFHVGGE